MQALDPNKVTLVCSVHSEFTSGCSQCNMVNLVRMVARAPAGKQLEEFEKLEALIHAMCELEDEGKLDVNLQRHPTITIERDVDA